MHLDNDPVGREALAGELDHEPNDLFGLGFEPCRGAREYSCTEDTEQDEEGINNFSKCVEVSSAHTTNCTKTNPHR